jgi:lipid-A-disaccharide synthase
MFIAGDPSGDHHTAGVVRRLKQDLPGAELWGIGGPAMEREGFAPLMPFAPFNRMGFLEVAAHIGFFLRAKRNLIGIMRQRKPDALVCVDYSGFNIPMMKAAKRLGIPVVWYIAPMVWAWKRKRAEVLGGCASHIAVIFPFETGFFSAYAAPVSFVGNPTVELMERDGHFPAVPKRHPGAGGFRVAIVPGSRRQEIEHMLPRMVQAFAVLRQRYPGLQAIVSRYGAVPADLYRKHIGGANLPVFEGPLHDMLRSADCALVTSGTATLETALMGVPLVVAYHTSRITYAIAKRLVKIGHIGLPNIVAGETLVPECIQEQAEAVNLAHTLERFIESPRLYDNTVTRLVALRNRLGEKKPSVEVSSIIRAQLEKSAGNRSAS